MTNLESFTELKRFRDMLASSTWATDLKSVLDGCRFFSQGPQGREHHLSTEQHTLLLHKCYGVTQGDYHVPYFSECAGTAIKTIIIRALDVELKRLADLARTEAAAVLETIGAK